ncbi:hypothetical protein [Burkholderia sp. F1]|uniref:hypothetical protein n=1 Tax=Burkholderia sp. F1 TaxID=3366817 RepID=UPI003D72BA0D
MHSTLPSLGARKRVAKTFQEKEFIRHLLEEAQHFFPFTLHLETLVRRIVLARFRDYFRHGKSGEEHTS